jgi:hypothetical protein
MAITTGRPATLSVKTRNKFAQARLISGVIAGESSTRTVAQFPVTQACSAVGYDSLLVGVEYGSGSGTVVLEPLYLDVDAGVWMQFLAGAPAGVVAYAAPAVHLTPSLSPGQLVHIPTWGRPSVLFRVNSVGGGPPTDLAIIYAGGYVRTGGFVT